jgi:hypothetical protein
MSIVKEQETKNRIKAKGIITEITVEGFLIEDEKEERIDLLKFEDFEMFVGKAISFSVVDVEKVELE